MHNIQRVTRRKKQKNHEGSHSGEKSRKILDSPSYVSLHFVRDPRLENPLNTKNDPSNSICKSKYLETQIKENFSS